MKKRLLALVLTLVLIAALGTLSALAAGEVTYTFENGTVYKTENGAKVQLTEEELADFNGVNLYGIAGFDEKIFPTMQDAYNAISDELEENGGLGQDGLTDDQFNALYTDKVSDGEHSGVKLTWTIFGTIDWNTDLPDYFITGGRAAAWYGSDTKTIREIIVNGYGDNATINYSKNPTMSYQWWGDSTDSYQSFTLNNLTINSKLKQISISANYRSSFDLDITGCTVNGSVYHYFNGRGNVNITGCKFNGTPELSYAFMAQGNETEPLNITFSSNTVSGYARGINIDQVTANVVINGNTITPGKGYSAIQISGCKNANISENTINDQGNFLTIHENIAKNELGERVITVEKNTVNSVEGTQGYLIYDDIQAAGKYDDKQYFTLNWTNNTIDKNIITTQGIKGDVVHDLTTYIDDVLNPSARIGDTTYETLEDAVAKAHDGDTIYILKDIVLNNTINAQKTLKFVGETEDGSKPVISSTANGIFSQAGSAAYTLNNLELMANKNGQWYIYHSANRLTVNNCDFTMADDVTYTGNVIMGEGNTDKGSSYALTFTGNNITANSRAAITGVGNNSVITGNKIDLINEEWQGGEGQRTSMIALTAKKDGGSVKIENNTFTNANRALAVDNSTLDASDITYKENKFIDVRYAFELSSEDNASCGTYSLNNNYYEFNGSVSEPKVEDAAKSGSHFEFGESGTEYTVEEGEDNIVNNDVYYLDSSMRPQDLNTYVPNVPDPHAITVVDPANGSIKTSLSNASKGAVITVTATPDQGYELAYITVDGEKITGDTFTMPDKAVTVSAVFVPTDFPFVDVKPGDWHYDYVAYVYENGLMNGVSATTFEPNANMTRAMVWTILARIDGETITGADWVADARAWAMANGVSDGTDANGLVTREQFVTMLWRFAGEPTSTYSLAKFTDNASVSDWAETAMAWAVENGIITGVTDTTIVPAGTATRAQCAAMLMRFVENV